MRIFDLHCDTFCELFDRKLSLDNAETAVNLSELSQFETAIQTFAVFLHPVIPDSLKRYTDVLSYGKRCLKTANIEVVKTAEDLKKGGKKALLSVEGGVPSFDPGFIETLYRDGIRTVSLTWNYDNPFAGGALETGSLTALGKSAVRELNTFDMVTDLSHLNRKSFFEVAQIAEHPIATHTGVDYVKRHPRNLTDDQLKMLRDKNGLVGLCVYPEFIGSDLFDGFYCSLTHCLELGLEDNLSIGSDFDGAEMHENLNKLSDLKRLYAFLCKKNLGKSILDKLFFENSYKFYNMVLTNSEF